MPPSRIRPKLWKYNSRGIPLCFEKEKIQMDIDYIRLMNFSEEFIIPILRRKGFSSIDVVSGMASFHSSYMPVIEKIAKKFRIDPRILIIELCKKKIKTLHLWIK